MKTTKSEKSYFIIIQMNRATSLTAVWLAISSPLTLFAEGESSDLRVSAICTPAGAQRTNAALFFSRSRATLSRTSSGRTSPCSTLRSDTYAPRRVLHEAIRFCGCSSRRIISWAEVFRTCEGYCYGFWARGFFGFEKNKA